MVFIYSTRRQCIAFLSSLVVLFTIILGGNFMVRGQFSSGAIALARLTFTRRMVSNSLTLKETVTCNLELDV